ncbi:MAG: hypothetical protein JSV90_06345 [Methanobacteriota archaeon]|nr:MAG: hypothetical protein JSV90_06345 [Euryarchaeota archaeon]
MRHLLDISGTRPLRQDQATAILVTAGRTDDEAVDTLDALVSSSALVLLRRNGEVYYVRGRADAVDAQHV